MSQDESLDADLLASVPDADAVRALYERHFDAVFRFAVRRCRNPEDVADLVSSVFLELFSAAAGYDRGKGGARAWLLGIAARCLADERRSEYRRADLAARLGAEPELGAEEHDRVEAMIDAARLAPAAERALAEQLTRAERALFLLVAHDRVPVADASRSLGLSPLRAGCGSPARAARSAPRSKLASAPVRVLPRNDYLTPFRRRRDHDRSVHDLGALPPRTSRRAAGARRHVVSA